MVFLLKLVQDLSNTYLLETKYNWKGICVEPIPYKFKELCVNRPKSLCYDYAVYNVSNKDIIFSIANDSDMLSGISSHITHHKTLVDSNNTQKQFHLMIY